MISVTVNLKRFRADSMQQPITICNCGRTLAAVCSQLYGKCNRILTERSERDKQKIIIGVRTLQVADVAIMNFVLCFEISRCVDQVEVFYRRTDIHARSRKHRSEVISLADIRYVLEQVY
jgi:hypothetical protein